MFQMFLKSSVKRNYGWRSKGAYLDGQTNGGMENIPISTTRLLCNHKIFYLLNVQPPCLYSLNRP